ncbi:alpha/beta fold hydrolase [Marinobacter nanhaiticus D15-8W]|uniref:Alpha/beta fold hydrolase n=1 Tax=Marinobacter nanhaiticus D15-8W TaxID=626887 RepID=N6WXM5_9GAMM|nr:alpha/beta fold hydrolase [Marinobacter nanhaiticus]ENO15817.1 alpha/beta fold hydrolase [Marinobacter nanhaiticus D15-8W]BES73325.1 alpha/beta fold hydrolase [Marinobacter nanhaiticus D15-8W]
MQGSYRRLTGFSTAMLAIVMLLSGCSRQDFYEAAIAHERNAAGLVEATVDVDGRTIAYLHNQTPRDGDTLVLLHGFAANKENWLRMAGYLTESYNVYAIDLPGHGESNRDLERDYSIDAQVGYVRAILDALVLERVHMVGNSMGGAITALYAATYPDRIITATLLDPAGIFEYDSELVSRVLDGDNPLIVSKPGDFERLVDFALEQKPFVPWPMYSVMEEEALSRKAINEHIFLQIRDSGYQPAFRNALASITAPVLVIWGKEDRVINYRNADVFAERIPRARKVLLENVGHAPMIEVPAKTASLVVDWIESSPPTSNP